MSANAGTPIAKNVKAKDVLRTSFSPKDPYPNKLLTISSDAINKPNAAGRESAKDSSKDLFCIKSIEY